MMKSRTALKKDLHALRTDNYSGQANFAIGATKRSGQTNFAVRTDNFSGQTGVTVAELLIVCAIILVLAAAAVFSGRDMLTQAGQWRMDAQASAIGTAAERALLDMDDERRDTFRDRSKDWITTDTEGNISAFYSRQFADLLGLADEEYQDTEMLLLPENSIDDEIRDSCWMIAWSVTDGEMQLEYVFQSVVKYEENFRKNIILNPDIRAQFRNSPETRLHGIPEQNIPGSWFGYYHPEPVDPDSTDGETADLQSDEPFQNDAAQTFYYWMDVENAEELSVTLHAQYPEYSSAPGSLSALLYDPAYGNVNPVTFRLSVTGETSGVTADRLIVCEPENDILSDITGIQKGYQYYFTSGDWTWREKDGYPDTADNSPMRPCWNGATRQYTMRVVLDSLSGNMERPRFENLQGAETILFQLTRDPSHVFHSARENPLNEDTPFIPGENLTLSLTVELDGTVIPCSPNHEGPSELHGISSLFATRRTVYKTIPPELSGESGENDVAAESESTVAGVPDGESGTDSSAENTPGQRSTDTSAESSTDTPGERSTDTSGESSPDTSNKPVTVPDYERIQITTARHLQNLNAAQVPLETAGEMPVRFRVAQTADIDWSDAQQSAFIPIDNANIIEFDAGHYTAAFHEETYTQTLDELSGQNPGNAETALAAAVSYRKDGAYTISNLKVNVSGDAGLFREFSGRTLRNIILCDPDIRGGTNVGALAGKIRSAEDVVTIADCGVYLTGGVKGKSASTSVTASENAGGLTGTWERSANSGTVLNITDSYAVLILRTTSKSSGRWTGVAGGLIGNATGTITVSGSFADCYMQGGTIGGLSGTCGTDSTFENCFSAGYVLCGGSNGSTITAGGFTVSRAKITRCASLFLFDDITASRYARAVVQKNGISYYDPDLIQRAGIRYAFAAPESTVSESYYTYKDVTDGTETQGTYGEYTLSQLRAMKNIPLLGTFLTERTDWAGSTAAGYVPPDPPPEETPDDTGTSRNGNTSRNNASGNNDENSEPEQVLYVTLTDGGSTLRFRYGTDPETAHTWYIYGDLNAQDAGDIPWLGRGGLSADEKDAVTTIRFDSGIRGNMPAQSSYAHWFDGLDNVEVIIGRQYFPAANVPGLDDPSPNAITQNTGTDTPTVEPSPAEPVEEPIEESVPDDDEEETVPGETVSGEDETPDIPEDDSNAPLPPVPEDNGPSAPEPEPRDHMPSGEDEETSGNGDNASGEVSPDGEGRDIRSPELWGPGTTSGGYLEPITDYARINTAVNTVDYADKNTADRADSVPLTDHVNSVPAADRTGFVPANV